MLESNKFLVAGTDLHHWVNKAREEVFIIFSFPRGFREHGDVQMMESRAAVPPSGPIPTLVAAESGTRPPAEMNTSSAAGSESASPCWADMDSLLTFLTLEQTDHSPATPSRKHLHCMRCQISCLAAGNPYALLRESHDPLKADWQTHHSPWAGTRHFLVLK